MRHALNRSHSYPPPPGLDTLVAWRMRLSRSARHSCFISAPYGIDTSVLRHELTARNVEWADVTNIPVGATIIDAIRDAIERSDFLCVVVPSSTPSSTTGRWTLLEAGIAIGAGKPLLFIVDRNAPVPTDLVGFHYAMASATDAEAIRFHLDTFLKGLDKKTLAPRTTSVKRKPVGKRRSAPRFHSTAESEVARLFENAGFLLHEAPHSDSGEYQVDLAVWIDDLLPIFSSPILPVEVKRVFDSRARREAADRLRHFLLGTGAGVGLLVELTERDEHQQGAWQSVGPPPFVFAVSVAELRRALESSGFVEQLIQSRNRAVHGA
jgi:hypothetical protein